MLRFKMNYGPKTLRPFCPFRLSPCHRSDKKTNETDKTTDRPSSVAAMQPIKSAVWKHDVDSWRNAFAQELGYMCCIAQLSNSLVLFRHFFVGKRKHLLHDALVDFWVWRKANMALHSFLFTSPLLSAYQESVIWLVSAVLQMRLVPLV